LLEPDYEFWRLPEGHVPSAHDQQAAVTRLVERLQALQPELIYLPWPEDAHPDHLVVAACVRAAVLRWIELEPDVACTMWGYEVWSDHAGAICVDTSAVHERKLRALACHASQLQEGALEAACRSRMERRARVFDGRAASAEAFLRVEPRAWQAG
jgi:LmbE family N-acetylglucosaminyl deacetylase